MAPSKIRRGISLMEVLIATFVLAIGLLGVAALLPVGRVAILETSKADRAGFVGRAALRDVKVRRMLDPNSWTDQVLDAQGRVVLSGEPFAIDPLGRARGLPDTLGPLKRFSFQDMTPALAEHIFMSQDDLVFVKPPNSTERPQALVNATGSPEYVGDYSWLMTVTPSATGANQPQVFEVSVAVCYKRMFSPEQTLTAAVSGGYGGVNLVLANPVPVKENDWILLCAAGNTARWYRVVSASSPATHLTAVGPDWNTAANSSADLVVIESVVGVYVTTVELDSNPIWIK